MPASILGKAAQLSFGVDHGAEFTAYRQKADEIGEGARRTQNCLRQIEDLLQIAVPRDEPLSAIKHRDAVAHVVESHAQFGLALVYLIEQPGIVHRDDRLRREIL